MDEEASKQSEEGQAQLTTIAPRRRGKIPIWVILIVGMLLAASLYGLYSYEIAGNNCSRSRTIDVDVYDSFMGSGADPNASRAAVFNAFGNATHSCVEVTYLATDVANLITSSPSSQLPDIAIGLTEVTAEELGIEGYLVPYAPPGLEYVNSSLVSGLSPENYATPYEWQYLGVDYLTSYNNETGSNLTNGDIFQTLQNNPSMAQQFVYENPTTDPVGKEFLLWEYQFYTSVLHQNWTTFWTSARSNLPPAAPSWDTGFSEFGPTEYPMVVSFGTDPSYFAAFPQGFSMNSTFSKYAGKEYGWTTIYGASIVKDGVHNLALDEEFINWLLSPSVQNLVPLNEWMYPANETTTIPQVYAANPSVSGLIPLNSFTSPREIAGNLTAILTEWQSIM